MIKNYSVKILFYFSFFIVLNLINIFYTSSISPDFKAYDDYFEQFYGIIDNTGRENGLIYFFLVTQLSHLLGAFKFFYYPELIVSNAIHLVNGVLYLIGVLGLKNLLVLKGFNEKNIYSLLTILNFSPVALKLLVTMKPEVLAFAFLPWVLYFFEIYIEKKESKYLFLIIFPLITIFNSKATIVASVGLLGIYLLSRLLKVGSINKKLNYFLLIIFSLYLLIIYENYIYNSITIFQHYPTGKQFFTVDQYITFSFLYKINFKELLSFPFKDVHANSLVGILLLDTFGDYFQWYENNSESLFSINEVKYSQVWYFTHWRELSTVLLSFLFYFLSFKYAKRFPKNSHYYLIYIFGIIPLIFIAYGDRSSYDFSDSELFKSHYYSYLLMISIAFVLASIFQSNLKLKILTSVFVFTNFIFILGFPKIITDEFSSYLTVKNNTAVFCSFNNLFINSKDTDCFDKKITICNTDPIVKDVRHINYEESYKKAKDVNIFPLKLVNENGSVAYVESLEPCLKKVQNGYFIESKFKKIQIYPILNLVFFILAILKLIFYKSLLRLL